MNHGRPSAREISKRITEAKESLIHREGLFANPAKVVGELYALEIGESVKVWTLIRDLLEEIGPEDYRGARPPQKSYEKTIYGLDLFAFSWYSKKMEKTMYMKFALKGGRFCYVSLHESRPKEKMQ